METKNLIEGLHETADNLKGYIDGPDYTRAANVIKVQVKILNKDRVKPEDIGHYGSEMAAAFDIRACIEAPITLRPGEQTLIPTGLALYIGDPNYALFMVPRSGLGNKGLVLGNLTGLIDPDYQGELQICAWNRKPKSILENWADRGSEDVLNSITINPGDRIAQAYIAPVVRGSFEVVEEFDTATERGTGGWGHSGIV